MRAQRLNLTNQEPTFFTRALMPRFSPNLTVTLSPTQLRRGCLVLGMLALCQKRRRQEDEEDARRRQRYWDWRAVDPADYNPVYPFLPPPTPGSDVIIPTPMPPFFSDIDFYLSNLSVLNIRTSAPIIHTINGLALNLGSGLKLEDGKLTVEGGGPGGKTYTGTAPITVDNTGNTISLAYGNGLQVVNGTLQTREFNAAPPLAITGNIIYANLGSGFKANNQQGVDVYLGTGLQFDSTGAIELTNPPQGDLTAIAPIYIENGQVSLSSDPNYFKMDTTVSPQKLQLNITDPLYVTNNIGIGVRVGANIRVNDSGALQVDLPSYSAPLTKSGQGPNQSVSLSTEAPFKVTGNALTLDYESPLNVVDDKLSVTAEDPLEAGTNGLKLRLGQGLELDSSGALAVSSVSQNLTAESPLHILNDSISLHTDAGFLVDTATHSLKLNVAEPLQVDSTTGLGLNTDPNMFQVNTTSQQLQLNLNPDGSLTSDSDGLDVKVGVGLTKGGTGNIMINVEGGGPLGFTDTYNALTLKYGNGFTKSDSRLQLNLKPPLTTQTNNGALAINLASGLQVDTNNNLALNLEAPLNISNSKVALQYESPLTVIDDQNLTVTVEEPLIIGTNAIELSLAPSMTKTASGGLSLKSSNTLVVPENAAAEVQCVQPLERSSSGVMLNYDSNTLMIENNKLKVKTAATVEEPIYLNNGNVALRFNPYQFYPGLGSALSLMCPTYIYQTPPTSPMRLRNGTYNEYGNAEIWIVRQGMMVTFNMNMIGETISTGTQTWTLQFDGMLGSCLTGTMNVYTGHDVVDPYQFPTWIIPLEAIYSTQRAQGCCPIACSENGTFKQSTYCMWRLYRLFDNTAGYYNFYIELKSTTSSCKPIFQMSFCYEAGIAMS